MNVAGLLVYRVSGKRYSIMSGMSPPALVLYPPLLYFFLSFGPASKVPKLTHYGVV